MEKESNSRQHSFIKIKFLCFAFFCYSKDEAFLEDINMILNTADVPNIYESDEKAEITEHVTIVFLLWTLFIRL